jgi:hypothetical protein
MKKEQIHELFAHFGLRAGLLVDHNYSHVEEIVSPKNKGTFKL